MAVATGQIKSGQDCCRTNTLKNLFDEGYGIGIEPRYLVEFVKVYTETQHSILFLNQNYGECPWASGGSDHS